MRHGTFAQALAATLAMLAPVSLAAQAHFGFKGGVSFGNVSNSGVLPGDLGQRTGVAGGVTLVSGGLLGLGVDALYAQRGISSSAADANERRLDYVDIPAYLRVQLPTPGLSPFGYIGPQVSFEVRCRDHDVACPSDGRSTTDFAGVIGAGLKFGGASAPGFTVEARYVYGLKDLHLSTITTSESYKTRSFMLLGGILF